MTIRHATASTSTARVAQEHARRVLDRVTAYTTGIEVQLNLRGRSA